jgi:hypothetical protein
MKAPTYFEDFLQKIRLPDDLRAKAKKAHLKLRALLETDNDLKPIIVTTFLQGSYKRHTGIRPDAGDKCDVDVVVVTRINGRTTSPGAALEKFKPFLEKHYKNRYRAQGRSWRIVDGDIELDLVPTSAPSEATETFLREASAADFLSDLSDYGTDRTRIQKLREAQNEGRWRAEILWIPDREAKVWRETNPLAQIDWTIAKNDRTSGHYVNVVKVTKWWRKTAYAAKHPKGYPLEHLVGANCPDGIDGIAEGFVHTAEAIVAAYGLERAQGKKPKMLDHGVNTHDVLGRLTPAEFAEFYDEVIAMARDARRALDEPDVAKSIAIWREIFGDLFPEPPKYTERTATSSIVPGRFA